MFGREICALAILAAVPCWGQWDKHTPCQLEAVKQVDKFTGKVLTLETTLLPWGWVNGRPDVFVDERGVYIKVAYPLGPSDPDASGGVVRFLVPADAGQAVTIEVDPSLTKIVTHEGTEAKCVQYYGSKCIQSQYVPYTIKNIEAEVVLPVNLLRAIANSGGKTGKASFAYRYEVADGAKANAVSWTLNKPQCECLKRYLATVPVEPAQH